MLLFCHLTINRLLSQINCQIKSNSRYFKLNVNIDGNCVEEENKSLKAKINQKHTNEQKTWKYNESCGI